MSCSRLYFFPDTHVKKARTRIGNYTTSVKLSVDRPRPSALLAARAELRQPLNADLVSGKKQTNIDRRQPLSVDPPSGNRQKQLDPFQDRVVCCREEAARDNSGSHDTLAAQMLTKLSVGLSASTPSKRCRNCKLTPCNGENSVNKVGHDDTIAVRCGILRQQAHHAVSPCNAETSAGQSSSCQVCLISITSAIPTPDQDDTHKRKATEERC